MASSIAAEDETRFEGAVTANTMDSIRLELNSRSSVHIPAILGYPNCIEEATNAIEKLNIEDIDQVAVPSRLQAMREFACHLSFFLAGYK